MYPMSLGSRRFVELGFIFVYWTLNLSLSSSRYCTVPAPGRHGADHSRSVSVSYYPYRNRIVGGQHLSDVRTATSLSEAIVSLSFQTCQISLSVKVLPRSLNFFQFFRRYLIYISRIGFHWILEASAYPQNSFCLSIVQIW